MMLHKDERKRMERDTLWTLKKANVAILISNKKMLK